MSELVLENNKLLKGWEHTKIRDLVFDPKQEIVDGPFGSNLKAREYVEKGVPIIRLQNVDRNRFVDKNIKYVTKEKAKQLKRHNFKSQDIVITKLGAPLGEACIVPEYFLEGIIVADIVRIRLNHEWISRKFLTYLINSEKIIQQFEKYTKGTTRPRVNLKQIRDFDVEIPPLNEQKRIVEKIEELFSIIDLNIENITKVDNQLSNYRLSLLDSLFMVDATKEILLNCGEIGTGGTPSRTKPEYYGSKFPWVKTAEVKNNVIYETGEKITQLGLDNSNAKMYPENSVILAMYGEGKTRGRCSILGISASTNQACAVMVCNPEKLFYKYYFYWLQSQYYQVRRKSSGGNQPNLNLGIVKKLKIPLPDILIQEEIVCNIEVGLSQIDNLKEKSIAIILYLQNMKSSILKLAFEGKLVSQDPNDEPASELFKRIKLEK